jgi:hypothetical protein
MLGTRLPRGNTPVAAALSLTARFKIITEEMLQIPWHFHKIIAWK